jgi:hypothetical protein
MDGLLWSDERKVTDRQCDEAWRVTTVIAAKR